MKAPEQVLQEPTELGLKIKQNSYLLGDQKPTASASGQATMG